MKNYLKLVRFLSHHKKIFLIAVTLMLVSALFEGIQFSLLVPLTDIIFNKKQIVFPGPVPRIVSSAIMFLNGMEPQRLLYRMSIAIVLLFFVKHFVTFWYGYLMNDLSQRIMRDIRAKLFDRMQNLSLDYFGKKRGGELISRITHDVLVIENALSYGITDLFRQSFTIIIFVMIAFTIHWKASSFIFLILPMISWPIARIGKKLKKLSKSIQIKMADIHSHLWETISGIRVVKAFCNESYEIDRFKIQNNEYYRLNMKTVKRLLLLGPITEIFGLFCAMIIIFSLGRQVMHDQLSFGVFALFMVSIMSIISRVKKLAIVNQITQRAIAANDRIYEVLESKPTVVEKDPALTLAPIRDRIKLEKIFFRYDTGEEDVLYDVNLEIIVGELVAIVGPTGAGKTTLMNLIPRFYDPTQGSVLIDGIDLKEVSFQSLRGQMGIVTQDTILFNDTVRQNIAYGFREASQQQVEESAHKAYAHQFIQKMSAGYQTFIGDRGFRLSGGEKQRIAIARAILKNPPILILDEATSQLDSESEKYIQHALDQLMQGRTVIAIAHRLSTVMKANKIVVLEKGRIVGLNTHENLLKDCPLYRRLYETQFQI